MTDTTQLPPLAAEDEQAFIASVGFRERLLLAIAGLFLLTIQSGLTATRSLDIGNLWYTIIWIICAVAGHLALRRRLPRRDPFLFPTVMLLSGWGLTSH